MKKKLMSIGLGLAVTMMFVASSLQNSQAREMSGDNTVMGDCGCDPAPHYFCSCSGFSSLHYMFVSGTVDT